MIYCVEVAAYTCLPVVNFLIYVFFVVVVVVSSLNHVQLFCDPMDCSPPGSSGISHARILEQVAISFFRGSF